MENVIKKLSEIESVTEKIMEDVSNQKKQMADEYEERCKAFDAEADAHTAMILKKIRRKLETRKETDLSNMQRRVDTLIERADSYYQENHQDLSLRIYNKLIRM